MKKKKVQRYDVFMFFIPKRNTLKNRIKGPFFTLKNFLWKETTFICLFTYKEIKKKKKISGQESSAP